MLEQWLLVVKVLLGPHECHPPVFKLATLLEAANEVNSRLRAQEGAQQDMPAALVRLIQTEFNKSFQKVFTSHLPVRWPHLTPLIRTLTTGNFRPNTITMPDGFRLNVPTALASYRATAPLYRAPSQRGGDEHTATSQVAVQNPNPLPHLQVGPGFRLRQSMEKVTIATGSPVPQKADGRPFCMSYHLKGVCNSNCGGRHAHRTLYPNERGILSARKSRFCADTHLVSEISAPPWTPGWGPVENTTLSTRSRRSQGSRRTRSRDSNLGKPCHPPPHERTKTT